MQRRVATLSQTKENPSQEAPHSAGDLLATALAQNHAIVNPDASQQPQPAKERVKWPRINSNKEWQQLDEDLDMILEVPLAGATERKIETVTTITYNVARDRFGTEERKEISPKVCQLNRREDCVKGSSHSPGSLGLQQEGKKQGSKT